MEKELLNQEKSFFAMFKFLLWLFGALIISFIGISNVFAQTYDAYLFNAQLYDNVNGSLSTVTTNFSNNYWTGTIPSMTANSSGGAWGISSPIPLIESHTYSMTVFVSHECGNTVLSSYNRIGVGSSFNEAKTSYQNNSNVNENLSKIQSLVYGQGLQFAFTTSVNANYIVFPFATSVSCNNVKFDLNNITIEDLGSSGVSETTINNSLSNQTNNINSNSNNNRDMILNNQASNTQTIIDNQSSTTQAIIDSSSSNTQAIIDSQNSCVNIDGTSGVISGKFLDINGNYGEYSSFSITDYIPISSNSSITVTEELNNGTAAFCFYNNNKTKISCNTLSNLNSNVTIPNNANFIRLSVNSNSNRPKVKICTSKLDEQTGAINNLNDSLNDNNSSGATTEASDFFSNFNTNTFGLTSIITVPLNLIQSLTSSTCSPLHLPLPYLNNKYLDLPCMTSIYQQHFGTFFALYQTITYGIIAYWVCVRIFNHVKDFKNPEHDEIEVVDL